MREDIRLSQMIKSDIDNKVNKDTVKHFCNSLGQKFQARDYQIDAVYNNLRFNRSLLLSPTASGKSFIIYALIRYYTHLLKDKKCLLIVLNNIIGRTNV